LTAAGCCWGLRAAASSAGRPERPGRWACAFAALFVYACGAWWASGEMHPDAFGLLARGTVHPDRLYMAAVETSIRNFGRVSLGLDGLSPVQWHFFSAAIFAFAGKLSGAPQLSVHAIFLPLFAPTMLAFSMSAVACRLAGRDRAPELAGLVVALATWMLPEKVLGWFATWDPVASETFGVGLAFFFIGALRQPLEGASGAPPEKAHADRLLDLAWISAMTLTKVSVGFTAAVWLSAQQLYDLRLRARDVAYLTITTALCLACFPIVMGKTSRSQFVPLWFVRVQPLWGLKGAPVFALVHWLPLWLGIAALPRGERLESFARDRYAATLLALAALGGFASFNLTIRGGSGVYFSMLAPVFAIPWTAARLIEGIERPSLTARGLAIAAVAGALVFRLAPAASGLWKHASSIPETKSTAGRSVVEANAALRDAVSREPKCGVYVGNAALLASPLNADMRCFEVPFYWSTVLERPLLASWMPFDCRTTQAGFWWGSPQAQVQPPESPSDEQLCVLAKRDGLACVERLSENSVSSRFNCP
ncbi:MAG: hypothetical protein HY925_16180, partial [Elusimicrobia bacterium]|nr:hypothetical protein [Elusimicrobiota bacterium]